MARKSTYGLTPAQLGRLLAVSAWALDSVDAGVEEHAKQTLLQEYLSRRLSEEPSLAEALLSDARRPAGEVHPLLDRSMRQALLDSRCDPDLLRVVKDHCKRLSAVVTSGPETLMTTTIYYAAIAAALVHHGQRISQLPGETLAERFSTLMQRPWMDPQLQGLFTEAAKICRRTATNVP